MFRSFLALLIALAVPLAALAGDTNFVGRVIVQDGDDEPTCSTASGAGMLCVEQAAELQSTIAVAGASTLTGNVTMAGTLAVTGATTLTGGGTLGAALSCGDFNLTNVGDISLDTISSDGSTIGVTADTLTSGGTDDYGLAITQTLNDTGAAGGSDVYRGLKVAVTTTDITGWDEAYLLDLLDGSTSRLKVSTAGVTTLGGDLAMGGNNIGGQLTGFEDLTGDDTMTTTDCGRTVTTNDASRVITLPAVAAGNIGCRITFVMTGADDVGLISLSPNASDGIFGMCCGVNDAATTACVALSGADNKDLQATAAEINKGDNVTLISDGSTGWYAVGCVGAGWASEG